MADYQERFAQQASTTTAGGVAVDEGLRSFMLGVYNYMALGVAFTALVIVALGSNPALLQTLAMGPMKWVAFAGVLGMGFFAPRLIMGGSALVAHAAYWGYAALWGLLIAPMVVFFLSTDPMMVMRAFMITAVMFAAMSLFGYTTKRDLSPFATFFFMAAIGLIVAMLLNVFFFQSELMSFIVSALVVLVFAGVTAWETQMIKEFYYAGDGTAAQKQKSIFGAFMLYGSFVTLFIHILNMLGIMNND